MVMSGIKDMLVGRRIKDVRRLTDEEMEQNGWDAGGRHGNGTAIVLDNDTMLFASSDEEGNSEGAMFGQLADGQGIYVFADA
jgi:hypothetical protein